MVTEKDPRRQVLGQMAKANGKRFEDRLDASFAYYRAKGFALVEKTPEPMRPTKSLGKGRFLAVFEKKAQPDYKGIVKGGRTIVFEAKYTTTEKLEQSRVQDSQAEYMTRHEALGAECYVLAGFASGEVYRIPWSVWATMKERFGRKYVKEADLDKYRVKRAWNDVLFLIG